ncbi:MAG: restriction endonuclease subunit R [Deltaproteobacteria bacterium RIFCSPLOWO2_12_FULL_44_12]|nr:MAG: restriction endonuclease subunit R [Deltaproteobacteria bacterium RIFCSPHIGHO2_01_FULL_43_49]OGQ15943.1 MAG: restriction endonuclease subunit R [Deltaproteobacteria bacterium RIFCSPHIGHO2_02_FULL_44_53]OGQ29453.1 MAG: restriction endonuclease subunit R [Deltaproteobacteria bacterium RIFCSPHIGHO2_12_FULL_44_21]OGQ30997.1 MAG: restriction endonuclease subunit R [Deltaproteobacteria bacterium RIFCSPLOWO2_01_FULL_45_74]OGQ44050.1 MAG: restriction endonuclease subunit R [Deltaproteobacteria 
MRLKEYQQRTLTEIRGYLDQLTIWKKKAGENPDLELDFPVKAWEKAGIHRPYSSRKNGIGQPLPAFCLKIPTGGGKTLLAVKTLDLVNMIYLKRRTGLVLWIVPTTQIYRQTIQSLKDKNHPYRQHLDLATGGHTQIIEKTDHFSPQDIQENLVVLMLMLPSANRKTKETLKVFKDSGGFQNFFPPEDDIKAQEAILKRFPNLDTYEKESGFWGRQIKTSLGNTLRTLSPVIILDEGHKAYSEGAQETLRGFNPCLIAELSATPVQSNVLVDITGQELLREEMIKLDLHLINKASPDWKDTLLDSVNKRSVLEKKAREYEANTGVYIRPICLIQVERTGKDQRGSRWIHSEQVREHLIKVMGIAADEIAVKTSEKDELKEVDDTGGLFSRDCKIRYIITKQALQEGWDCAFAYVLTILTNPSSKNSLTQLVGRILRQPYARKTHVRELDESYVHCFQQKANKLLESIRDGFAQEGLGDLRGHIATEGQTGEVGDIVSMMREKFKKAAGRTILPVFVVKNGHLWRPVNYEMDIEAKIPWADVDLKPVKKLTLSFDEKKDVEMGVALTNDRYRLIETRGVKNLEEGGIPIDPVFMTRQLGDIVPNPWQAHELAKGVLDHFLKTKGSAQEAERLVANNFVFIIEELRKQLEAEKDRLAEHVFLSLLEKDELRFLIIGRDLNWSFPREITFKAASKRLTKEKGRQLELSLYEAVPEEDFNETEKAVAWYLEDQHRLFFWFRNRSRHDYSIQGWRQHRIYPDFIFTMTDKEPATDYNRVYVVETKGIHLKDNEKTRYVRKVFNLCTRKAKERNWNELGLEMKDKIMGFEVLPEDEWQARLNEIMMEATV